MNLTLSRASNPLFQILNSFKDTVMVADNLMAATPIVTGMAGDTPSSQCLLLVIHLTNIWEAIHGHLGILSHSAAAAAKSRQLCPTLCDPIDGSPPGSPVPGIRQARTLEWVAISSPMHESEKWKGSRSGMSDSSRPHGLQPTSSSTHGIFQAKVLEWGAIAFSTHSARKVHF